jgi:hypothetical protein
LEAEEEFDNHDSLDMSRVGVMPWEPGGKHHEAKLALGCWVIHFATSKELRCMCLHRKGFFLSGLPGIPQAKQELGWAGLG